MNVFKFIQIYDWMPTPAIDGNPFDLAKRFWFEKSDNRGAIAQNEHLFIMSQSPTLALIVKSTPQRKAELVINEGCSCFPRHLNQVAAPIRQPFAEVFHRQVVPL